MVTSSAVVGSSAIIASRGRGGDQDGDHDAFAALQRIVVRILFQSTRRIGDFLPTQGREGCSEPLGGSRRDRGGGVAPRCCSSTFGDRRPNVSTGLSEANRFM